MVVVDSITAAPVRELSPIHGAKRRTRSLALYLYIVVFSGSIYLLFGTFDDGSLSQKSGDSPLYLSLLLVTYSVMFYQLAVVRDVALGTVFKSIALLLFVSGGFVSFAVAGAAGISVIRFLLFIVTISAGLLISSRYSLDEFCETFFFTSFAITTAHFLAYPLLAGRIVYDSLARETLLGLTSYAGLFPHKSVAATFFSLSLMISLARYFGSSARTIRRSSIILACGSIVALLMCGAVGRLLFLLISVLVGLLLRAFLRKDMTSLFFIGGGLILGAAVYLSIGNGSWIVFFGRNWNLTGREELFDLWPRFFWDKPVFGYGFDGFFTDMAGAPASYLSDLDEGRGFSTFESVYLDLLIEFGLVGGFLFVFILISALWQSIRFYIRGTSKYKFVPLLLIVWAILGSALDSGVLRQNSIDCVLVFWIYFGVDNAYRAQPRRSIGRNRDFRRSEVAREL
jgi:exopolysaccharide production protein ExoQ